MHFREHLATRNRLSVVLFWVICFYIPCSIAALLLAFGVLPKVSGIYDNLYALIIFAMVSSVLIIVIATFHLAVQIKRKKRATDRLQ